MYMMYPFAIFRPENHFWLDSSSFYIYDGFRHPEWKLLRLCKKNHFFRLFVSTESYFLLTNTQRDILSHSNGWLILTVCSLQRATFFATIIVILFIPTMGLIHYIAYM